ncbi:MAG: hypothetical protein ABSF50_01455 [Burkholderiaceae bacterium]|jgi:hypothetical protein
MWRYVKKAAVDALMRLFMFALLVEWLLAAGAIVAMDSPRWWIALFGIAMSAYLLSALPDEKKSLPPIGVIQIAVSLVYMPIASALAVAAQTYPDGQLRLFFDVSPIWCAICVFALPPVITFLVLAIVVWLFGGFARKLRTIRFD